MSSSLSPPSGRVRTVVKRICLLLPLITLPAPSSKHEDTPTEPVTDEGSPDLLSPQEQVMDVLETHGGRVWQADIVTHTGWSKAKVSRVLSEMETTGEIVRFRSGRQKVVCLTEATPESVTDQHKAPPMG
ncbi:helix-turn-helix transcriptional regulator [Halomontanus rarus]|uniref:helix-turn-helix transcriptional regulator n=1 Tax=Halomontanus rarus TaxID=3034020 RepID=UPI003CE4B930